MAVYIVSRLFQVKFSETYSISSVTDKEWHWKYTVTVTNLAISLCIMWLYL